MDKPGPEDEAGPQASEQQAETDRVETERADGERTLAERAATAAIAQNAETERSEAEARAQAKPADQPAAQADEAAGKIEAKPAEKHAAQRDGAAERAAAAARGRAQAGGPARDDQTAERGAAKAQVQTDERNAAEVPARRAETERSDAAARVRARPAEGQAGERQEAAQRSQAAAGAQTGGVAERDQAAQRQAAERQAQTGGVAERDQAAQRQAAERQAQTAERNLAQAHHRVAKAQGAAQAAQARSEPERAEAAAALAAAQRSLEAAQRHAAEARARLAEAQRLHAAEPAAAPAQAKPAEPNAAQRDQPAERPATQPPAQTSERNAAEARDREAKAQRAAPATKAGIERAQGATTEATPQPPAEPEPPERAAELATAAERQLATALDRHRQAQEAMRIAATTGAPEQAEAQLEAARRALEAAERSAAEARRQVTGAQRTEGEPRTEGETRESARTRPEDGSKSEKAAHERAEPERRQADRLVAQQEAAEARASAQAREAALPRHAAERQAARNGADAAQQDLVRARADHIRAQSAERMSRNLGAGQPEHVDAVRQLNVTRAALDHAELALRHAQARLLQLERPETVDAALQAFTRQYHLVVDVRPPGEFARGRLDEGSLPKPEFLKAKTIDEPDRLLGAPRGSLGRVGYFRPELPERPANMNQVEWDKVVDRFAQRLAEHRDLAETINELVAKGDIRVEHGVVKLLDPRGPGAGPDRYRDVTGDLDLYQIQWADGREMSTTDADQFAAMLRSWGIAVEHGAHLRWEPTTKKDRRIFDDIVAAHRPGGTKLIRFEAGEPPARVDNATSPTPRPGPRYTSQEIAATGGSPWESIEPDLRKHLGELDRRDATQLPRLAQRLPEREPAFSARDIDEFLARIDNRSPAANRDGVRLYDIAGDQLRDVRFSADHGSEIDVHDVTRVSVRDGRIPLRPEDPGASPRPADPPPETWLVDKPRAETADPVGDTEFRPNRLGRGFDVRNAQVVADGAGDRLVTPSGPEFGPDRVVGGARDATFDPDSGSWVAPAAPYVPPHQVLGQDGEYVDRSPEQWHAWEEGLSPLTDEQRYALWFYSDDLGGELNPALRGQVPRSFVTSPLAMAAVAGDLDRTMAPVPFDAVVYRQASIRDFSELGVAHPAELARLVGRTYTQPAYTSTSLDPDVWTGDIDIVVQVPRGSRGRYLAGPPGAARVNPLTAEPGDPLATSPTEQEFLIERGTTFRIVDARESDATKRWTIEVRVAEQGVRQPSASSSPPADASPGGPPAGQVTSAATSGAAGEVPRPSADLASGPYAPTGGVTTPLTQLGAALPRGPAAASIDVVQRLVASSSALRRAMDAADDADRAVVSARAAETNLARYEGVANGTPGTARAVADASRIAGEAWSRAAHVRHAADEAWDGLLASLRAMAPSLGQPSAPAPATDPTGAERRSSAPFDAGAAARWAQDLEIDAREARKVAEHERHEAALAAGRLRDRNVSDQEAAQVDATEMRERADRSRLIAERRTREARRAMAWLAKTASLQTLADTMRIVVMVQGLELARTGRSDDDAPAAAGVSDDGDAEDRGLAVVEVSEEDGSPVAGDRLAAIEEALRAAGIERRPRDVPAGSSTAASLVAYAPGVGPRRRPEGA